MFTGFDYWDVSSLNSFERKIDWSYVYFKEIIKKPKIILHDRLNRTKTLRVKLSQK